MGLITEIARSCSAEMAERFKRPPLARDECQRLAEVGKAVLTEISLTGSVNACAHLTALWVTRIREEVPDIPVVAVAGNLTIEGTKVYYSQKSAPDLRNDFAASSLEYDGHFWAAFPHAVGEISLFRSAYGQLDTHWLKRLVLRKFGNARGLAVGPPEQGMRYDPKFVLTNTEVSALVGGSRVVFSKDQGPVLES